MKAPVVVFAVGNPSRGDDALGPQLGDALRRWAEEAGRAAGIEFVDDFQLNIEHALDLQGRRLALFIDAGTGTRAPFDFYRIFPVDRIGHATHALAPEAVLRVYREVEQAEPPPSFVLCVAGQDFTLGQALSDGAARHLAQALAFGQSLLSAPEAAVWAGRCVSDRPAPEFSNA